MAITKTQSLAIAKLTGEAESEQARARIRLNSGHRPQAAAAAGHALGIWTSLQHLFPNAEQRDHWQTQQGSCAMLISTATLPYAATTDTTSEER